MKSNQDIFVYADWVGLSEPTLVGILHVQWLRGKELFGFEYDKAWITNHSSFYLDPNILPFGGPQYVKDNTPNFGVFLDSSPDRWGRMLLKRREAIVARNEQRLPHTLGESDFLLGVFDDARMGGLRFKLDPNGHFLDNDAALSTPPMAALRDLEYASQQLETDESIQSDRWIKLLLAPGSSLGGARPKANVLDENNELWVAKFPSTHDEVNISTWEYVANILAKCCGIEVPDTKLVLLSSRYPTFLSKRFDRIQAKRIHMASAMTLLGYKDGDDASTGVSYLHLAEFIMRFGSQPNEDLKQLFTRIAFNIAISNADDHLRNHAFLLTKTGWRLSPAYDLNPQPDAMGLKLNINESDNSLDFDLLLSVSEWFRINQSEGKLIIQHVKSSVSNWKSIACEQHISRQEQETMEKAFTNLR
ncbi:MAG: type II toxin-antitoxin system HipA family toxin [Bacteroidia bacterium]|nr:type II toxin-antitoxin system HipA family toxin [Bacteroidia bacterium]